MGNLNLGRRRKRFRALFGAAAAVAALSGAVLAAAPAQAAGGSPTMTIYYSPGCNSGQREYIGLNAGEWWVNDRFLGVIGYNNAGAGQLIRDNAASVRVYGGANGARVSIYNGSSWSTYTAAKSTGVCFNFGTAVRNHNQKFKVENL